MEINILFYFFSTVAQVLAAISALLAVFTHFKINEILEFLVGDGRATLQRMEKPENGYILKKDNIKFHDRLRDSVGRKSILGIKEVIDLLANQEKEQRKTIESNPSGLQFLKKRFEIRQDQIGYIKSLTKKSISVAFIAIFISLVSLVFISIISYKIYVGVIILVISLTLVSMGFSIKGVFVGLQDQERI